ncbi:hypothetical protein AB0E63_33220 [Kribbella sp. NPDC026596]|uniref:hypothetical protein n=1 Tax=Kribbella sp. NPDC026596 TaxID=3155122 RepID=UPI0033ED0832
MWRPRDFVDDRDRGVLIAQHRVAVGVRTQTTNFVKFFLRETGRTPLAFRNDSIGSQTFSAEGPAGLAGFVRASNGGLPAGAGVDVLPQVATCGR